MNVASLREWAKDAEKAAEEVRKEINDGMVNNHVNVTEDVKREIEEMLLRISTDIATAEIGWSGLKKPTPYAKYYSFAGTPTAEERAARTREMVGSNNQPVEF